MKKALILWLMCASLCAGMTTQAQIVINEVFPFHGVADENSELQDWVEIYNSGTQTVNLSGFGLSDRANQPDKYVFAPMYLDAGERILVLCSGGEFYYPAYYWGSTILSFYPWKYLIGNSEPDFDWYAPEFDDAAWNSGPGPIGYGDADDATIIENCNSVYMRRNFELEDAADMTYAVLNADYDDGFVAYLNGYEIARSYNVEGYPPSYDAGVTEEHEAQVYQGLPTDVYFVGEPFLGEILQEGTNTLSIHVVNGGFFSSDLTGRFDLLFGTQGSNTSLGAMPSTLSFLPTVYLQAPFKLSPGEEVILSNPSMNPIDNILIPEDLQVGDAVGRFPDGSANWCITDDPTPNQPQDESLCGGNYTQGPTITPVSGYYAGSVNVTATPASTDHVLRYTTNGDAPKETDPVWPGSFTINETSVLSVRAFSTDGLPSIAVDRTYFINEDNHDLHVASIITDSLNLWDWNTGIYVDGPNASTDFPYFGANFWQPWSKYSRLHWFNPQEDLIAEEEFDLEIHGGWSRAENQRSFRIDLKGDFSGNLDQVIISDKPWIDTYNNFNLRAGGQHVWTDKIQDAFLCRKMKGTFVHYMAYEPTKVYLNGDFWGVYGIREKIDEKWAQYNFELPNDDVDLMNSWNVLAGDRQHFDALLVELSADPNGATFYNTAASYLNIQNHVDYIAAETFYQNLDWFGILWGANNIKLWRPRTPDGKWSYVLYDTDACLGTFGGNVNSNYLNNALNPLVANDHSYVFNRLVLNPDYRRYFINRYADLMNTTWQPAEFQQLRNEMKADMEDAMPQHIDRWPEMANLNSWNFYTQAMVNYTTNRLNGARQNILETFELPEMHTIQLDVDPVGAGYILISTIVPENYPWSGVYFEDNTFEITAVANPGYEFGYWEQNALLPDGTDENSITVNLSQAVTYTAVFAGTSAPMDLQITELNYNSHPSHVTGDWVEIYNASETDMELGMHWIQDLNVLNKFTFPIGTMLGAGERLIVAQNPEQFTTWHPNVSNVYGPAACEFDNGGDFVALMDPWGNEIVSFTYEDSFPWPVGADEWGHTLELIDSTNANDPASWADGCMFGSPGEAAGPCAEEMTITEINVASSLGFDTGDWLEITNTSPDFVNLQGWGLSDNGGAPFINLTPMMLAPGDRAVIAKNIEQFTGEYSCAIPENIIGGFDFGFSGNGETVSIFNDQGQLMHSVSYDLNAPWPTDVEGTGYTLELPDPSNWVNTGSNWTASECVGGTPGAEYTQFCSEPLQSSLELVGETLVVNASGGLPPYTYTWLYNGVEVGNSSEWTVTGDGDYQVIVTDDAGCEQTSEIMIGVGITSSEMTVLAAFPNPFDEHLTLQLSNNESGMLEVRNVQGQLLVQQRVQNQVEELNTSDWAAGIYVVTLYAPDGIKRVKVLKN